MDAAKKPEDATKETEATARAERGFSLRTQILTAQRYSMGDSLLACLMMICSNGPSLDQKEEVEKFLLAVVAQFKSFKKKVPSKSFVGKRPRCASASKPNLLFCLSFQVWSMFYSMISLFHRR